MCGIAGFAHARSSTLPIEESWVLERMIATLTHRGPDGSGEYHSPAPARVSLGHRRLSIIDREGGVQPFVREDLGLALTYNGEIYNYLELNTELAREGFPPRTRSDAETILLAYAAWGEKCLERFNGMFAFVIFDRKQQRLFGARDRFGKKPFYFSHRDNFFAFGSEPRAILEHPQLKRELNPEAFARYLLFEHVPAPYSIFKEIGKLPAGHSFRYSLETGQLELNEYWDFYRESAPGPNDKRYWLERIPAELEKAVERRLISDEPLGLFLSGGLDSSALALHMTKLLGRGRVKTFAIGSHEASFDESPYARQVAEFFGTEHHEIKLHARDGLELLPTVAGMLPEPFADPSILPCYQLAKFTRGYVKVALGGDGGDELFAGYPTYQALPFAKIYNSLSPKILDENFIRPLARRLPAGQDYFSFGFKANQFLRGAKAPESERLWRWMGAFVPEELGRLFTPDALKQIAPEKLYEEIHALHKVAAVMKLDPVAADSYMQTKTYLGEGVLTKVDRATMACGLEARAPFLDKDFAEMAACIPSRLKVRGQQLKWILKESLRGKLPDAIIDRPKHGFAIPVAAWFRNELRAELENTFEPKRVKSEGRYNAEYISEMIQAHVNGKADFRKPLWTLFMFEKWRAQHGLS